LDCYLSYFFLGLHQSLLQGHDPGLVALGPLFHVLLEQGQVLASDRVGFYEEGKGVVQAGQLSALVCLAEICLIRPIDDFLPDLSGKVLGGVGSGCQLVSDPALRDVLLVSDSILDILGSLS